MAAIASEGYPERVGLRTVHVLHLHPSIATPAHGFRVGGAIATHGYLEAQSTEAPCHTQQ